MNPRTLFTSVIFSLLLVSVDLYLKTHLAVTVPNPGTFLGIALPNALVAVMHIVIFLAGVSYLSVYVKDAHTKIIGYFVLIISLSNLFDRLVFGAVIDYIQILGIWFNIADLVITLGIFAILYKLIKD